MTIHRKSEYRVESAGMVYELIDVGSGKRGSAQGRTIAGVLGEPVADPPLDRSALPLIIIGYDPQRLTQVLLDQRGNAETALRPIAVAGIQNDSDAPIVEQLADEVLSPEPDGGQLLQAGEALLELALRLQEMHHSEDDETLRLLQFLESRRQALEPRLDPSSRIAYSYPLAEAMLGTGVGRVLDVLTDMAQHGVFNRRTVDRVHVCPDCHGYRIPVKEICPECRSPDVSIEVSIHHFRCGYMAPESRFTDQNGYLTCPKCKRHLRHIGVEYNRPSEICVCGSCGFWAQRPELRAWCVDCNSLFAPEDVKTLRIHSYTLTAEARSAARAGSWNPGRSVGSRAGATTPSQNGGQTIGSGAASQAGFGELSHNRDVLRTVIGIAQPSQWPIAVFMVQAPVRGNAGTSAEQPVHAVERVLRRRLQPRDILGRVRDDTLLLAIPESEDRKAPSIREMKRWTRKCADAPIEISRIDAQEALQLLDEEQ